jgi:hypothetical protein
MFSQNTSYVAILRDVAYQCSLPYVSSIHELLEDGTHIYGIEFELPGNVHQLQQRTFFFWANPGLVSAIAYESAAKEALIALERFYGFVIIDTGTRTLQMYRSLAQRLFPLANRGTQLARLIMAASYDQCISLPTVRACAQQLLDEVALGPQ